MIALGVILLVLGFVLNVYLLWVVGVILIVAGAVFWALGSIGGRSAAARLVLTSEFVQHSARGSLAGLDRPSK